MFTAALFTIAKIWKQPKCPSMEEYIHTYKEILFGKKKEMLLLITTWMDLEGIVLSEISQTHKDKYCMTSLTYGI